MGARKIRVFPDRVDDAVGCMESAGLAVKENYETEFAYILVGLK